MTATVVVFIVGVVAIKTFSYGAWEAKRRNIAGGVFAMALAVLDILLAAQYLVGYLT